MSSSVIAGFVPSLPIEPSVFNIRVTAWPLFGSSIVQDLESMEEIARLLSGSWDEDFLSPLIVKEIEEQPMKSAISHILINRTWEAAQLKEALERDGISLSRRAIEAKVLEKYQGHFSKRYSDEVLYDWFRMNPTEVSIDMEYDVEARLSELDRLQEFHDSIPLEDRVAFIEAELPVFQWFNREGKPWGAIVADLTIPREIRVAAGLVIVACRWKVPLKGGCYLVLTCADIDYDKGRENFMDVLATGPKVLPLISKWWEHSNFCLGLVDYIMKVVRILGTTRTTRLREKWFDPCTHYESKWWHDLSVTSLPTGKFSKELWGDLVVKFGPEVLEYFGIAPEIENRLGRAPKSLSEIRVTHESMANDGGPEAILTFLRVPAEQIPAYVEICRSAKQGPLEHLVGRVLACDGKYTFSVLPSNSPYGPTLGHTTNCCQRLKGAGAYCAVHGAMSADGGFVVVRDANGKIVAQSWYWQGYVSGDRKALCFDNIEALGAEGRFETLEALYTQAAKVILAKTDFAVITVGCGHSDITPRGWEETSDRVTYWQGHYYTDARGAQWLVAEDTSRVAPYAFEFDRLDMETFYRLNDDQPIRPTGMGEIWDEEV